MTSANQCAITPCDQTCVSGGEGLCRATTSSAKVLVWPAVQFRIFKGSVCCTTPKSMVCFLFRFSFFFLKGSCFKI